MPARRQVGVDVRVSSELQLSRQVVGRAEADKDPRRMSRQRIRRLPGLLQGFPDHFQQQPLLRIHAGRLARCDPEESGVEFVHPLQKAAETGGDLPRCVRVRIVILVDVPARDRHFGNRVTTLDQQRPEIVERRDPAGQPQSRADDGDRFRLALFGLLQSRAQIANLQQRALDRRECVLPAAHGPPVGDWCAPESSAFNSASASASDRSPSCSAKLSTDDSTAGTVAFPVSRLITAAR